MAKTKLKIATCQFPISADVKKNARNIRRQIRKAAQNGADLVHFSEAALPGYAGNDIPSFEKFDWDTLRAETRRAMALAANNKVWLVLGSAHYLGPNDRPTNCLYLISSEGKVVDRYDKSRLTKSDAQTFSRGDHLVTFTLKGLTCGLLICADSGAPELYNAYKAKGVEVMLHSFYNARFRPGTPLDEVIPAQIRIRALDSSMWVIANNSTGWYSCWPSFIVRPDGTIAGSLKRHKTDILYHEFPDPRRFSWVNCRVTTKPPQQEAFDPGKPSTHPRAVDCMSEP